MNLILSKFIVEINFFLSHFTLLMLVSIINIKGKKKHKDLYLFILLKITFNLSQQSKFSLALLYRNIVQILFYKYFSLFGRTKRKNQIYLDEVKQKSRNATYDL